MENRIRAIKALREMRAGNSGESGLKECKEQVDKWSVGLPQEVNDFIDYLTSLTLAVPTLNVDSLTQDRDSWKERARVLSEEVEEGNERWRRMAAEQIELGERITYLTHLARKALACLSDGALVDMLIHNS